ncbi:MAG TPA: response regulator [Tepidisphaeraceae bacterium]|nr:response regulator [Tepidisphaeraceae bacterium]
MSEFDGRAAILIVDDKPEKLLALEAVLEDMGQRIVRAYSGREALRHLLNEEFAVVLLDVNMPGMDGFEAASLIRQRPSSRHTPIIFITAFGDDMHMARGYSLGAVDYITAPVIPEVLRSKVSVFVELYQKTAQVRRQSESLRRRATQLQKLSSASLAINSAPTIQEMLRIVAESARDIIGAEQCVALLPPNVLSPGRKSPLQLAASFSDKHSRWRQRELKLDEVATTVISQTPSLTRLSDSEFREHPDWDIFCRLDLPASRGGLLAAPLTHRDGSNLGLIFLLDRAAGQFSGDDESLLLQLTQIVSIAIQNTVFAQEREANRVKDEFLATLSHELRTPLNAIVGWTRLLRMEDLPEEATHGLEVIDRNVKAQTKLIEDLLDVSRITTGKMRLNMRSVSVAPVVQAAVDTIRPAAEAKGIALSAELQEIHTSADPDRLQQVVWNLLSNSLKFTPAGGWIRVSLERLNSQVQIQVADSGQGIEPEFLNHVFDRFRQADSTTTRVQGGLGIGLTLVRHIIELHGGAAQAQSAGVGRGATFTVTIPVVHAKSESAEQPVNGGGAAEEMPEGGGAANLSGTHILLVDDEADTRELMAEVLRRAEADVRTVASVREAFDRISRESFDILVSDIALPEADGYSLIQMLRQFPPDRGGRTPAIALTAYARQEDRLRALSAGFQMHLAKPIEPQQLIAAVAHLTRDRGQNLSHPIEDSSLTNSGERC